MPGSDGEQITSRFNWNISTLARSPISLLTREPFLVFLLASTFLVRAFWAVVVPAFQTPDEPQHFAYIQSLGEEFRVRPSEWVSQEIATVEGVIGLDAVPFHPAETQMFAADSLDGPKEGEIDRLPDSLRTTDDTTRANSARQYPPTYYLIASVIYRLLASADTLTILLGVRILSSLISTGTMLFNYLTLRRFFGPGREAMACGLLVAMFPMYAYMGMAVNVDVLVWLVFSIFLYLATRALDDGLSPAMNVLIGLSLVAGLLTKQTFLIAVPIYVILLALLWLRKLLKARAAGVYLATVLGMLVALDGWLYVSGIVRTSPDYAGEHEQTARSIAGFLRHFRDRIGDYANTFNTAWGTYGWLDTSVSLRVFGLIRTLSAIATVGLAFYLAASAFARRLDVKTVFFVTSSAVYVAAWVVLNYLRVTGGEAWLLQGRYFFPMIVPIVAVLLRGLLWYVPHTRGRDALLVALVIGMFLLHVDALSGYVIPRFYA